MLLREPEDHLVPHEDAELLFQLGAVLLGFSQAARDGHEGGGEEPLRGQGAH